MNQLSIIYFFLSITSWGWRRQEGVGRGGLNPFLITRPKLPAAPGQADENTRGRSTTAPDRKELCLQIRAVRMTSVSAVLFPRACARACERDRVCVCG